jgi:intergrase/recombinase
LCIYSYRFSVWQRDKVKPKRFFTDAREKAIALKHHQDIAQKMRERIGLKNSAEAHDIYIPSEAEVAEQREAAFRTTKELFSSIFRTKSEKASNISKLKLTIAQNPNDAQLWEQLALLHVQDKDSIQDGIKAYR